MTAKILFLDLETAPSVGYVWGKYDQNVIEFERDWFILCVGHKWMGHKDAEVFGLDDFRLYENEPHNDLLLVQHLWHLLDDADIVVAHNGDSFDIKKSNARFLSHGMSPPSTFKTVDTLKIARKHFKFDSNKLNDLCRYLGLGEKVSHTGWALWKACLDGDPEAWRVMKEYNTHDVVLLEKVYYKLRPWAAHPDVRLYSPPTTAATPSCPNCGSEHVQRRGVVVARSRKYQRWNCQGCGAWFQGTVEKN